MRKELIAWYRTRKRRLPWRETKDPYRIWVSEVMLQQTTVPAVLPYYERWFGLFPDMEAVARTPLQKVLKAWEGLGYYERARNLHRAARIMSQEYAGRVPDDYEAARALPGFGPYIAAAVLSFAYDKPLPVLDANVRRVTMRLAGLRGRPSSCNDKLLLDWVRRFFPARKSGEFNQAMMELGALVCRPKNPACLACPVQSTCLAFERGEQEIIPAPQKTDVRKVEAAVGIIREGNRYLVQQRPQKGLMARLWEFPGGKREKGETLQEALHRELREELGIKVRIVRRLLKVRHAYTRFRVTLSAFECELCGNSRPRKARYRWVSLRAMKSLPFPSGSAKIVRFLEDSRGSTGGPLPRL